MASAVAYAHCISGANDYSLTVSLADTASHEFPEASATQVARLLFALGKAQQRDYFHQLRSAQSRWEAELKEEDREVERLRVRTYVIALFKRYAMVAPSGTTTDAAQVLMCASVFREFASVTNRRTVKAIRGACNVFLTRVESIDPESTLVPSSTIAVGISALVKLKRMRLDPALCLSGKLIGL